jgi:hypothetical protein
MTGVGGARAGTGVAIAGAAASAGAVRRDGTVGEDQEFTDQELTGQEFTGQELTGQELIGQELTGQELIGKSHSPRALGCGSSFKAGRNSPGADPGALPDPCCCHGMGHASSID